jgi:hypothetical protein
MDPVKNLIKIRAIDMKLSLTQREWPRNLLLSVKHFLVQDAAVSLPLSSINSETPECEKSAPE